MKHFSRLVAAAVASLALSVPSRADLIEQLTFPPPSDCSPCVWFQATGSGDGHSGVVSFTSLPVGTNLYGGWLTFTEEGVGVSYLGGATIHDVRAPGGGPLTGVRGAVKLTEAYGVIVDTGSGTITGVTLYAGVVLWTPTKTYLVLVGGIPTAYEFTVGGASIPNVRGAARLAARIIDTDPGIGVAATLFSGTLLYTSSRAYLLTTFGLGIAASEVLFGGSSIAGVRGVTAMGGDANTLVLNSAAFLWTPTKTLMLLTGGVVSVSEILDEDGASIANTWGVTRHSPLYTGFGGFRGIVTVVDDEKEHMVVVNGGVGTSEIEKPSGGSLTSGVHIAASNPLLHQASNLSVVAAYHLPAGIHAAVAGVTVLGTVLASQQ